MLFLFAVKTMNAQSTTCFFNGRKCVCDVERNNANVISSAKIIIGEGRDQTSVPLEAIKIEDRIGSRTIKYAFIASRMIDGMIEGQTCRIEYEWKNGDVRPLNNVKYHAPKVHMLMLGSKNSKNLHYVGQNKNAFRTSLENLIRKNSVYSIDLDVCDAETKESAMRKMDAWVESVHKGDLVIIYMNGHGEIMEDNKWGLRTSGGIFTGSDLVDKVREIATKEVEVRIVVDACYSEALVSDLNKLDGSVNKYVRCLFSSGRYQESSEVNGSSLFIKALTSELKRMQSRVEQNYDIIIAMESAFMNDFRNKNQTPGIWTAEDKQFDILPSYDSIEEKNNLVGKSILPFWGINEIENKAKQGGLYALDGMEVVSLAGCALAAMTIPKTVNDLQDRIKYNRWTTIGHVCASAFLVTFVSSAIWTNGELKTVYEIPKKKANEPHASVQVCPFVDSNSVGFGLALNF